jgi:hypothetical protein
MRCFSTSLPLSLTSKSKTSKYFELSGKGSSLRQSWRFVASTRNSSKWNPWACNWAWLIALIFSQVSHTMLIFIARFSGNFKPGTAWMPKLSPPPEKSCMSWKRYFTIAAAVLVSGLVLLSSLALANRRNQTGGFNQEIQYDDFAFPVLNVRNANTLAGDLSGQIAEDESYVVTLKIANHARRVNYSFNKSVAILVDDRGTQYHLCEVGQKAFGEEPTRASGCESDIPPDSSCITNLVFQLPAGAKISHLRISEE